MTKTLWTIFWSSLYISYLAFIFPYLLLYIIIASSIRRTYNIVKINRIMKKEGLPVHIRNDAKAEYRSFTKSLSLGTLLANSDLISFRTKNKIANKVETNG